MKYEGHPISILTGPTATGKSSIALQWARQNRDIEIINADSLLVYKKFNIGTAKPSAEELQEMVYTEGWRPEKNLAHYRTLQALPLILGPARQSDADYLDACRAKRNTAEYDAPGHVSAKEAKELVAFARELREDVIAWLEKKHPKLSPWAK